MAMRPSTMQRDQNLRTLVAEFSLRDMGYLDASLLLGCSASGARNYVDLLLDAGVLVRRRTSGVGGRDRTVYRLNPDAGRVSAFLAMAAREDASDAKPAAQPRAGRPLADCMPAAACHDSGPMPVRRDPLVTALFGRPGP
jgi:hypothetical protein